MNTINKPVHIFAESFQDRYNKVLNAQNPNVQIIALQNDIDFKQVIYAWAKDKRGNEYRAYISKIPTIKKLLLHIKRYFSERVKLY